MTALVLADQQPQRRTGFFHMLAELLDVIRLARAMSERYDALSRLSEDHLAKRGLKREDLPRVVVTGHYGL